MVHQPQNRVQLHVRNRGMIEILPVGLGQVIVGVAIYLLHHFREEYCPHNPPHILIDVHNSGMIEILPVGYGRVIVGIMI